MTDQSNVQDAFETAQISQFSCGRCAAELTFAPGTRVIECHYCGFVNEIGASGESVGELDYLAFLGRLEQEQTRADVRLVKCQACGAEMDRPPDLDSFECIFCRSNVVAADLDSRVIRPTALLPFAVTAERAHAVFREWIGSRWFAPTDLRRFARSGGRLEGVYVPFWTYDSRTFTRYAGQRGDDYWETETYTAEENGRRVRKKRRVRKTRWRSVEGRVTVDFDDVLVSGSRSLPYEYLRRLDPWDLENLEPYQGEFLAGFRTERYQVGLRDAFEQEARALMDPAIRSAVGEDIGGDHQRIADLDTRYADIAFKHLLLPVWVSVYRYRGKVFRILINGRTGELQGERPWSAWKIVLIVLGALAIVALVVLIAVLR